MSLLVGDIVIAAQDTHPDIPGHVIASALSVLAGGIVCAIGLLRWGWIVEFISLSSVSAFVTGAAFTIASGQVSTMMGISGFSTRDGAYLSVIRTLRNLPDTQLDAALGLTALTMLYLIRYIFNTLARKQPHRRKLWFFMNTLRTAFVILLYTMISWLMNLDLPNHDSDLSPIRILGDVPRGFQVTGRPQVTGNIISIFAGQLPATVIVLLIEHISIAKSFGRVNGYTINPSQELVAIGVTNLLGPFLGAYPATGSFSRTAIKSKAGVRTPLAGVVSAIVVLLAIYALPAVFFYIPNSALSAVIIHAVLDVLTPPSTLYHFWRVSPLDAINFVIGVLIIVFSSVEYGIYATMGLSALILVVRLAKAKGHFLGPARMKPVWTEGSASVDTVFSGEKPGPDSSVLLPIDHSDGSNPDVRIDHPAPGIFVYRFSEEFCYLNAARYMEHLVLTVQNETRKTERSDIKKGDRQWNDVRKYQDPAEDHRPILKAVVFDFSSVNILDISTVQIMMDTHNVLAKHAAPEKIAWLFACVHNPWTKRALLEADLGFKAGQPCSVDAEGARWNYLFHTTPLGDQEGRHDVSEPVPSDESNRDGELEKQRGAGVRPVSGEGVAKRVGLLSGVNRLCFYPDLPSAVESAVCNKSAV